MGCPEGPPGTPGVEGKPDLVTRWIRATCPFPIDRINPQVLESYARSVGVPEEALPGLLRKITGQIDQAKIHEILSMHASEIFPGGPLEAAVRFFESPEGTAYREARIQVVIRAELAIMKHIGEAVQKALGEG